MNHPYLLQILMREREREIRQAVGRVHYHAPRRGGGSGISKKIERWLHSTLLRIKAIAASRQGRQPATVCKDK